MTWLHLINKLTFFPLAFLAIFIAIPCHAATLQIQWSGVISDLSEFAPDAAPEGVVTGAMISGITVIDIPNYDSYMSLNGSHSFGDVYRYSSGIIHQLTIAGNEWSVLGGNLSFIHYSFEPKSVFDVFSTSDRNEYEAFPNYVGEFELGYAFFAENSPSIFSSAGAIEDVVFDLESSAYANGFLSTRLFDQNDDIIGGYYLDFNITSISTSLIPEPSVSLLSLAAMSFLISWRKRENSVSIHI